MKYYWMHCWGPDGPTVLLVEYSSHTSSYNIIEDGREARMTIADDQQWLHKWKVDHFELIVKPEFKNTSR